MPRVEERTILAAFGKQTGSSTISSSSATIKWRAVPRLDLLVSSPRSYFDVAGVMLSLKLRQKTPTNKSEEPVVRNFVRIEQPSLPS